MVLIEGGGAPGSLNHLGVEVDSTDEVAAANTRLTGEGLACATEDEVTCCYAVQDKVRPGYANFAIAEPPLKLVAAVVGSGIAAQRLSPNDVGLQLIENSFATGAALVALILAFGSVSGAHFNPVVTLADRTLGGMASGEAGAYVGAQITGGCIGAIAANLMFDLPAIDWSTHERAAGGLWFGEAVATFGLVVVILGVARSTSATSRAALAAVAVGGYIAAAYWFTSSTSFANPAVTIARTLTDTFSGIAPASLPAFVAAQLAGGIAAVGLAMFLWPALPAADLIVSQEPADAA